MDFQNAYPLFTQVETDFLDTLMQSKYSLESITHGAIKPKHMTRICDAITKAKRKHPDFAELFTNNDLKTARSAAFFAKQVNDDRVKNGSPSVATDILYEEVNEAEEAFLMGDREQTINELCDVIAVCVRMIEFAEENLE